MHEIKIPQYEFALKLPGGGGGFWGGVMREGERICGTLRYTLELPD